MKRIMILVLLLCGCAKQSPVSDIVKHHVQLVDEAIDYANNNLEESSDMQYMKSALKTCQAGLVAAEKASKQLVETYKADIKYWKALSYFLLIIIAMYFGFKTLRK